MYSTDLQTIIMFIRARKVGDLVYRQEIIKLNGKWRGTSTFDNYRNYLTHAGYLKIEWAGAYRILKEVSASLTYARLVKEAYPDSEWTQKYKA